LWYYLNNFSLIVKGIGGTAARTRGTVGLF
jgi:hypothetical protein